CFKHYHPNSTFASLLTATSTSYNYTLSLHDALPISVNTIGDPVSPLAIAVSVCVPALGPRVRVIAAIPLPPETELGAQTDTAIADRKSTRLNSSHVASSYAVFCLKKKNALNVRVHLR